MKGEIKENINSNEIKETIKSYCVDSNENDCINEISNQYINNKSFYNNIETIYILSDIHGDLSKYLSFLSKINIINSDYNYNDNFDIYKELNNYITYNNHEYKLNDNIYNIIKIILTKLNIKLNEKGLQYKNTLIIQMGDIFDSHLNKDKIIDNDKLISSFINNDLCIYFISLFLLYEFNNITFKNNTYYIQLLGNHDFIIYNEIFDDIYNASRLNQDILIKYYGGNNINKLIGGNINNKYIIDNQTYKFFQGILNADELLHNEQFKILKKKIQYKKIIFDNIIHFQLNTKSNNSLTFHSIIIVNNNCILSHAFFNNFFDDLDKFNYNLNDLQKIKIIDAIFQYINKKKDVNILFNNKFFNLLNDSLNYRIDYKKKDIKIPNNFISNVDKELDFDLSNDNKYYFIGHQPSEEIKLLKNKNYIIWFTDHKISKSFYTDYNYDYKRKTYIKLEFKDEKLFNYEFGDI